MDTFKFAELTEIMFIANHMSAKLYISGEEIINQGDEADEMFIIFRGSVIVRLYDRYSKNECKCDHSDDEEGDHEIDIVANYKKFKFMNSLK